MSFNTQTVKDVFERAVSTGLQYVAGATGGVAALPSHPLIGGAVGAALSSVAKALVGLYYTGAPSLLRAAVVTAEDVVKDPNAKPVLKAVESKLPQPVLTVVQDIAKTVEDVPAPPAGLPLLPPPPPPPTP